MTHKCSKCKVQKPHTEFYLDRSAPKGIKSWCKPCSRENSVKWGRENKERHKAATEAWRKQNKERMKMSSRVYSTSPHGRFLKAIQTAKTRGIEFSLSKEFYTSICGQNCGYCGKPTQLTGVGLDRIDSSKGYIDGNVIPCCGFCNHLKLDYTLDELTEHIPKFMEGLKRVVNGN